MNTKEEKKIIKEIAEKYNLTETEVSNICKSPFQFLVNVMQNADRDTVTFPSVRVPSFGIFYCTEGRREFYKKLNSKLNGRGEE